MASGDANATSGELLAPEKIAPRATSRGNSRVIQPPSKNLPDNCSAVQEGKKRRREESSKRTAHKRLKGTKNGRSLGVILLHPARRVRVLVLALAIQIPKAHVGRQAERTNPCFRLALLLPHWVRKLSQRRLLNLLLRQLLKACLSRPESQLHKNHWCLFIITCLN